MIFAVNKVFFSFAATLPWQSRGQLLTGTGCYPYFSQEDVNRKCDLPGHPVVPIENKKQRKCKYCQIHKLRTKSGWRVVTNFKCGTCDIGLCSGENTDRNCFQLFHEEFVFGQHGDVPIK